ncbi:hypothetical protein KUTeg_023402 [Tegillarca granosa]|uniref:Short-chain collagen C4 n=1 Tax=Tegillarca granosa TaxID=220873 RepID=A0ABQ9E640_TEGGR|nr:hypothetical protein KUTeg_023402 [Tegillarca granosa]
MYRLQCLSIVDKGIVRETKEKRLLIDDPGHLQFEIDQLKSSVQTLTSTKVVTKIILIYNTFSLMAVGDETVKTYANAAMYYGYAGGSYYGHTGGAAEYVCAPPDPDFGKHIPAAYSTYLFGAEYETDYFGPPWQEDVPCAVCRSVTATSALMIPGKNHCYLDWTEEYRGRLASGLFNHAAASQYVCVDEHPEAIIGGQANKDGKLFYPVISECGALPCPPYKNNTELLCVGDASILCALTKIFSPSSIVEAVEVDVVSEVVSYFCNCRMGSKSKCRQELLGFVSFAKTRKESNCNVYTSSKTVVQLLLTYSRLFQFLQLTARGFSLQNLMNLIKTDIKNSLAPVNIEHLMTIFLHSEIVKETKEKRLLIDDPGHLQFEIDQLKSSVQTLTSTKGGALYVQWGRHRCTNNHTETVYSGYAGGSYFNHTGGAAEYVYAPPDPDFGKNIPAAYSTYLFGAEYETDYFGQPWQEDVPCAVCRSVTATSALMIPGKNHCYQNWKVEYRGRLASGHYTHRAASQYVCVDEHPEAIIGGNADTNGKLFYPVISECGALPCPPYKNNTELLCVVCSK